MQKIIFKFTTIVTTAIASHNAGPKIEYPKLLKPEIRVEKVKSDDTLSVPKSVSNRKTALS